MEREQERAFWAARWRAALERIESGPGASCLTTEEIADLVEVRLTTVHRKRVIAHLAECSFCAREVAVLQRAVRAFDHRRRQTPARTADLPARRETS